MPDSEVSALPNVRAISKKTRSKYTTYFRLLVYAQPTALDIGLLVIAFSAAVATGVPLPLLAILFGQLIDDFNVASCASNASETQESSYDSNINERILLVVYLAIAQFVFIYVHLVCWSLVGSRLAQRIRERYLKSLLRQEPSFFDNFKEGEVSSRLNGDIQAIRSGTSEKVGLCIAAVSCVVGAYVVSFIKYPKLAGILTCLIPAYLIMALGGGYFIEKYAGQLSDHVAAASSIVSEALSHVPVVHAFSADARLEASMMAELNKAKAAGARKAIATGGQSGLMYFIAYAANGLAFWQGSKAIADTVQGNSSGTSVGAVFTVIFVVVDATVALSQVAPFLQIFAAAAAAFTNLEREIERDSLIDPCSTSGVRLTEVRGHLQFRDVSFAHPSRPDVPVLKHISLQIPAGKHTALVGPSGSGKSTMAGLIMRIYDPDTGAILLDKQNLSQLNVRSLRSHVSLAQQEASLLDRSILENIAHGLINSDPARWSMMETVSNGPGLKNAALLLREGHDLDWVISNAKMDVAMVLRMVVEASKHAEAHDFISKLQHSYGTPVGPEGKLLSGGQRQRVALARALIKDPKVLVLDEATSALDSTTERRVTSTLTKLMSGKTMVSIAHRLSTIKNADKIVVMKAGEVVEEGTHSGLMAVGGTYANMVRLQSIDPNKDDEETTSINDATASPVVRTQDDSEKVQSSDLSEKAVTDPVLITASPVSENEKTAEPEDDDAGLIVDKSLIAIGRVFGPITRPYLLITLPALIATVIVGASFTIEAVIFGNTVGNLSPCKSPAIITSKGAFFGLMFFVLAIVEFFANLASWSFFGYVSESIVRTTRILSFRVLFKQNLQWHQSANRTPAILLNFITRDGDLIAGLSGSVLGVVFSIGVNLVLSIVFTIVIAWKIALVCLAIVPFFLGIGIMQLRVVGQYEERNEAAYTTSVSIGVEAVGNIKTIAALSLEDDVIATYRQSLAGPQKEIAKASFHANIWLALAYFIGNLGYALAFWWGGKQIVNGSYSQVQFLIVVFSLLVSAQLWSGMFALAPEISSAKAALARVSSLLSLEPEQVSRDPKASLRSSAFHRDIERAIDEKQPQSSSSSDADKAGVGISLQNVIFTYPSQPDVRVLNGLSLSILPGQFCALVGSSGAGKSTIVSLIERMYTPTSGSIFIGNREITKTTSVSFRDDIAYVPQDNALFDGSIRFNIGLGARPDTISSDAEIEEACKIAHIHDTIIALPDGYDTRVGNSGGQFSGGQRQRLAIARALVRKPRLLILDEPTSALDAETESALQEGLDHVMQESGMTVIIIAHRLKTIRRADIIYVIDRGRVAGQGTHEELLRDNQVYGENVLSQALDS